MATIKTAVMAAIMMLMFLTSPNARCAAFGDDKSPTDKSADTTKNAPAATAGDDTGKTAASTKPAPTTTPGSAVEGEIQQLRDELYTQQALLQSQQARIAQLEAQLHIGSAQPVVLATVPASEAISAGSAPSAYSSSAQPLSAGMVQPVPAPPQSGGTQKPGEQQPSPLSWKIGAAEFTPGGWADITGIFRSTDIGSGTGTTFGSIPFNNQLPQAGLTEFRATAQTSRLNLKVETNVSDSTSVLGYVETDFNGYQPPNAYTSTNSGTFRLRLAFADIKHNNWEVIGGQTWSLLTPNRLGLGSMPADVFTGYRLDTNYVAGLVYSRQASFRVIYHATDWWSIAAALENPQQYAPTSVVFPSSFFSGQFDNGSGASNGTAAASNPAIPNLHPDIIVKSAFDWKLGEHALHLEAAGLIRSFKVFNNIESPSDTNSITEGSGSLNANFEAFHNFRLIGNALWALMLSLNPMANFHQFIPVRESPDSNIRSRPALSLTGTTAAPTSSVILAALSPPRLHRLLLALVCPGSSVPVLDSRDRLTPTTNRSRKRPLALPRRSGEARTTGSCNSSRSLPGWSGRPGPCPVQPPETHTHFFNT
jgi:hypothetical protein